MLEILVPPLPCPTVLIGPVADDPAESVSAVNRALAGGLSDQYHFVLSNATRRHGGTQQSRLNLWNLYYLLKHTLIWGWNLLRYRPVIAHYAISSGWALQKGLLFLRLARLCGVRTVGHLHSGGFIAYWKRLAPSRRRSVLRQFTQLDAFVVLSGGWQTLVREEIGVDLRKLHVINNPIDPAFEQEALRLPIDRAPNVLLALGVLGRDKGVLDLVSAAALVRDRRPGFHLRIVGPEREPGIRTAVTDQIEQLRLQSQIGLGTSVWGSAKLQLFSSSGILVLPSHYENFPLVVLEAAAAGQAIITTPVGAVPEFFRHGESALFVPPKDPVALAGAILQLLDRPEERARLAAAARCVFLARLSREGISRSLDRLYRSLLSSSAPDVKSA